MTKLKLVKTSIILSIATCFGFVGRQTSTFDTVKQKLEILNSFYPQEKIYMHFDKPYYSQGESIWFKTYLVNANTAIKQDISSLVYVELIAPDDKVLITKKIKLEHGSAAGDFQLPGNLNGQFQVRAYTNFMRNFDDLFFFKKEIVVFDLLEDTSQHFSNTPQTQALTNRQLISGFDFQFFPEGGDLVNGISSYLGFKAIDSNGFGVDITGEIFDKAGQSEGTFKSNHLGIGGISFLPEKDKSYYAIVKSEGLMDQKVSLPAVLDKGMALRVIPSIEYIVVVANTSKASNMNGSLLVGQTKGEIAFSLSGSSEKSSISAKIPKSQLPTGVLQITLFNKQGLPQCERLVFIENPNEKTQIDISSDKPNYNKRALVKLKMKLTQGLESIAGDLSMSITDSKLVKNGFDTSGNIKSHLLLLSELRGKIEDPDYYFIDDDIARKKALDQLMITQGWRRFNWKKLLANDYPIRNYIIESGLNVNGTLLHPTTKKPVKGEVSVTITEPFSHVSVTTDSIGRFLFFGFDSYDTTDFLIQGALYKEKKNSENKKLNKNVKVKINEWEGPSIQRSALAALNKYTTQEKLEDQTIKDFLKTSVKIQEIEKSFDFNKTYMLDGIDITAKSNNIKNNESFFLPGKIYGEPDYRIVMDSLGGTDGYASIIDIIKGKIPGLDIRGNFPAYTIKIRGASSFLGSTDPLFVIDGSPTTQEIALLINPAEVLFVDVLSGISTAMYGSRGSNGVIIIYTRRGTTRAYNLNRVGLINIKVPGYAKAREFYQPTYDVKKPEHVKPDYRTTLYWNPSVTVNEQGEASLEFYTADAQTTYHVNVEGITTNGIPVVGSYEFKTE